MAAFLTVFTAKVKNKQEHEDKLYEEKLLEIYCKRLVTEMLARVIVHCCKETEIHQEYRKDGVDDELREGLAILCSFSIFRFLFLFLRTKKMSCV